MPEVSKVSLSQFFTYCVDRNLPFAFYRLPETEGVKVIAQKDEPIEKLEFGKNSVKAQGFLFSPFQDDEHAHKIFIRPDIACDETNLPKLNFGKQRVTVSLKGANKLRQKTGGKKQYEDLVRKIKREIRKGNFEKIIAARVIKKEKPTGFEAVKLFRRLCSQYPHAFVSLVFSREYGLWIGASPEVLLEVNKKEFRTYALAGTKANTKQNLKAGWGSKEIEEHKIVSRYIAKSLHAIVKSKPLVKELETVAAGNLLHLLTTFQYKPVSTILWQKAVEALHPTPAVAGLPKQKAIEFILRYEKTPRGYYSGYLGPVNMDGRINLFVNLRCMQVLKNKLAIYIGCGITADSIPEDEWKESKIKSQTLLRVLSKNT